MKETLQYIKSFIKDKNVASVMPSSAMAVGKICEHIDFQKAQLIVEYGPGTGVISRELLARMSDDARLIVIETNPNFCIELNKIRDKRLIVLEDSVEHVEEMLTDDQNGRVDYIISGIPFSFFTPRERLELLRDSQNVLKPGGYFLAYQVSNQLKRPIEKMFGECSMDFHITNLPPYFIYEARKSLGEGESV